MMYENARTNGVYLLIFTFQEIDQTYFQCTVVCTTAHSTDFYNNIKLEYLFTVLESKDLTIEQ